MRKLALCLVLAGVALPSFAASRVTVEQLEKVLAGAQAKPDSEVAKQLSSLELTERLTSARLVQLRATLSGEKSQQALLALADASAFLDLAPADIPAAAAPDTITQRRIMSLTVAYLGKTLPTLPNLFAARDTVRFETRPSQDQGALPEDNPLRAVGRSSVSVFYQDGHEFVDAGVDKANRAQAPDKGLTTWGEFGPILGIVLIDAARSRLSWSHWELGAGGPQSVFRYSVPKEKSHYDVRFCCVADANGFGVSVLSQRVGYHGEITVDPDSGAILRLTAIADLDPQNPIAQASVAVEYGPVEMGGKTYFCPVRSIAIAESPDLKALHSALTPPPAAGSNGFAPTLQKASLSSIAQISRQKLLNEVTFRQYHLFRAEAKVVAANGTEGASISPASSRAASDAALATPPPASSKPAEESAVDASTLAPQPGAYAAAPSSEPPPEPVIPEITVSGAAGLPEAPALAAAATNSAVTLRLTARLVDLSLVALDKKGRPVTNLKPENLQIYDEGQKVDLRSFTQAGGSLPLPAPSGEPAAPSSGSDSPAPVPHVYSNRNLTPLKPSSTEQQANTIILLLDNNLSFNDLSNAREQMRTFLNDLHQQERVALYALRVGGFQVLSNPTTDHALVATALAKWNPGAQSISLGQEQEARNRQTMDYVNSFDDLLSVNGHVNIDTGINTEPLDPQLRPLGDDPGRGAFSGLVVLAHHLSALPGHKSLVWIASDNVLVDWTNANLDIDKGSRIIQASVLHAQEAMNGAHVSVYPLDASRLEAGGIDASIGTRNVALNPASRDAQIGPCGTPSMSGHGAQPPPEQTAGADVNSCQGDLHPGRATAQMQQDLHPIQGAYRELADATGGRIFRRSNDMVSELNGVAADGRATYLLSFTPAQAADDKYHLITVKLVGRKDVNLRYRTGYLYRKEPSTLKDRFRDAVLETDDATEIGLTADPLPESNGRTAKLGIAATDIELAQKDGFWTDKLDIYVVQREISGTKARVTGQSMGLRLKSATYQKYLHEGIPFNQALEAAPGVGSVRIVVLDENSGRMGSVTVPAARIGENR
jgi:VWFA-related protein